MQIIYDNKQDRYIVSLEGYEHITVLNTNDIAKARELFVGHLTGLFDDAVRKQLSQD